MKRALIAVGIAILLAGCKDKGACLSAHFENSGFFNPIYTTICNGSSCQSVFAGMYWVDTSGNVCDRWQYPDGKPEDRK